MFAGRVPTKSPLKNNLGMVPVIGFTTKYSKYSSILLSFYSSHSPDSPVFQSSNCLGHQIWRTNCLVSSTSSEDLVTMSSWQRHIDSVLLTASIVSFVGLPTNLGVFRGCKGNEQAVQKVMKGTVVFQWRQWTSHQILDGQLFQEDLPSSKSA